MNSKKVLQFQKDCFANYITDIRKAVPQIPDPYIYPDGNPIRPVLPIQREPKPIMLIGAFPSARFEKRDNMLIPIGDNLSPFAQEKYFDGMGIRTQASRESLDDNYFPQLGLDPNEIWITDIVKIYLYPDKHIENCKVISPHLNFINTHDLFPKVAEASRGWMKREIEVCNPQLIITLGDVAARTLSRDKKTKSTELLNGEVRDVMFDKAYKIAHLGHPEIRRRNKDWDTRTEKAITKLSTQLRKYLKK